MLILDENKLNVKVESGDIILFSRPCTSMDFISGCICIGAKIGTLSKWDHIGIVVCENNKEPYVLEANLSGIKMYPFLDRIKKTKSYTMAIRKLNGGNSADISDRMSLISKTLLDKKYNSSFSDFLCALQQSYSSSENQSIKATVASLTSNIHALQLELNFQDMTNSYFNIVDNRLSVLKDTKSAYISSGTQDNCSKISNPSLNANVMIKDDPANGKYFCSQLVAHIYSELGILDPAVWRHKHRFVPSEFSSSSVTGGICLAEPYYFSPDIEFNPKDVTLTKDLSSSSSSTSISASHYISMPITANRSPLASLIFSPGDILRVQVPPSLTHLTPPCDHHGSTVISSSSTSASISSTSPKNVVHITCSVGNVSLDIQAPNSDGTIAIRDDNLVSGSATLCPVDYPEVLRVRLASYSAGRETVLTLKSTLHRSAVNISLGAIGNVHDKENSSVSFRTENTLMNSVGAHQRSLSDSSYLVSALHALVETLNVGDASVKSRIENHLLDSGSCKLVHVPCGAAVSSAAFQSTSLVYVVDGGVEFNPASTDSSKSPIYDHDIFEAFYIRHANEHHLSGEGTVRLRAGSILNPEVLLGTTHSHNHWHTWTATSNEDRQGEGEGEKEGDGCLLLVVDRSACSLSGLSSLSSLWLGDISPMTSSWQRGRVHAPPLENTSSVSLADMVSLSLQHTYRNLHGTIERLDLNDGSRRSIVVVQSEERISDELRRVFAERKDRGPEKENDEGKGKGKEREKDKDKEREKIGEEGPALALALGLGLGLVPCRRQGEEGLQSGEYETIELSSNLELEAVSREGVGQGHRSNPCHRSGPCPRPCHGRPLPLSLRLPKLVTPSEFLPPAKAYSYRCLPVSVFPVSAMAREGCFAHAPTVLLSSSLRTFGYDRTNSRWGDTDIASPTVKDAGCWGGRLDWTMLALMMRLR